MSVGMEVIKAVSFFVSYCDFYKVSVIRNKDTWPLGSESISVYLINNRAVWEDPSNLWEDLMP